MDLKIILLFVCSVAIVSSLDENSLVKRLVKLEFGLGECLNRHEVNSILIEKHAVLLNQTQDKLEEQKTMIEEQATALSDSDDKIDTLSQSVELLQRFAKVGKSCGQLAKFGFNISDVYYLDNDGLGQGKPPFQVFCQMPEQVTIVGREVSIDVDHCDFDFCFEHQVNYNVPEDQLAKLLEDSYSCSQSLTLDCFSSPIKLLQWQDRLGEYHDVPNLNDTSCDVKDPVWLINSGTIEDRSLLPISGVRFGPHKHEIQKAKITIGSLQCKQEDEEPFNVKDEMKRLEENVDGRILGLEQIDEKINRTVQTLKQDVTSNVKNEIKRNDERILGLEKIDEKINHTLQTLKQDVTNELKLLLPAQCSVSYSYNKLTDSTRLHNVYKASGGHRDNNDSPKSPDWQGPGWYRVVSPAGSQISEHVRDPEHKDKHGDCNTHHGGWMLGGHPSIEEGIVTRTVCLRWDCNGLDKIQIRVVNCNQYYLYELKSTQSGGRRYCTQ